MPFNFPAIQTLIQFTQQLSVWVCVWGESSPSFAIPLLLVLRIVSEDSKAFPLDTSCMGFSGALLERGSFFISFVMSYENKEKGKQDCSLTFPNVSILSFSFLECTTVTSTQHNILETPFPMCLLFVFLTFSREAPGPIKQNNVQYSDAIFCDYGQVIIKATIQL